MATPTQETAELIDRLTKMLEPGVGDACSATAAAALLAHADHCERMAWERARDGAASEPEPPEAAFERAWAEGNR
ncbi:MAG: hypothetical protein OXI83_03290 [Gemmatimonadota bacterium]|nr:hypothetical protein [Gemmatimonadota bacterium]